MTQLELDYIKRAVKAFETGELSLEDQRKILQTISEITAVAATTAQNKLVDSLVE